MTHPPDSPQPGTPAPESPPPRRATAFCKEWPLVLMGDQQQAVTEITGALRQGISDIVLLGVTGSGKTFTMANVIAELDRPALVMAPNKTLAAQLFQEFKDLFPKNAVEYFISYYDYYQPEAYVPSTDTFIQKESTINQDIDKMRHAATRALFERRDVIVVSSVSCIYGLGDPESYLNAMVRISVDQELGRDDFLRRLIAIRYERNDISLERGKFRVRGNVVEIVPSHERDNAVRVEFWGDRIGRISIIDSLRGIVTEETNCVALYPSSHYVTNPVSIDEIIGEVMTDLHTRLKVFRREGKIVEAQRLETRTTQDMDLLRELGFCPGIENYSRYLTKRQAGQPPPTLLDYFPKDFLCIIDESHITVPQIGGMSRGDRMRKQTLVDYGFRLPAALDNRPLQFDEFCGRIGQTVYVSATPGPYELERAGSAVVEQIIRPTGLIDPLITIRPATHQIDDLVGEIRATTARGARVLVTTLTKKMSEEICTYFKDLGIKVRYLHSDIDSIQRVELLRDLRRGIFDVLIGINLLREGLDLPEVALVAVLDADKEGFLRSRSSLIQTVGRAARNAEGRVILYADRMTGSIQACLDETNRRRERQQAYNEANGITPQSIQKKIPPQLRTLYQLDTPAEESSWEEKLLQKFGNASFLRSAEKIEKQIKKLTKEMEKSSQKMEFENAAELRDNIIILRQALLRFSENTSLFSAEQP